MANLVRHLPRDSAYGRTCDPDWFWWEPIHDYLSVMIEAADAHTRAVVASLSTKPPDFPEPLRLPRPGDPPANAISSKEDVVAFFRR